MLVDGEILPPLSSLPYVSRYAAKALVSAREEGPFTSQDDILRRDVPGYAVQALRRAGCLRGLAKEARRYRLKKG